MQFINCLVKDDKVKNQTKKDYQRNIIPKVINRNKKEIYSLKPGTKYEKKYCYWDIITSMCKD